MVEVFKTDVCEVSEAVKLKTVLLRHLPGCKINIDLHVLLISYNRGGRNARNIFTSYIIQLFEIAFG